MSFCFGKYQWRSFPLAFRCPFEQECELNNFVFVGFWSHCWMWTNWTPARWLGLWSCLIGNIIVSSRWSIFVFRSFSVVFGLWENYCALFVRSVLSRIDCWLWFQLLRRLCDSLVNVSTFSEFLHNFPLHESAMKGSFVLVQLSNGHLKLFFFFPFLSF